MAPADAWTLTLAAAVGLLPAVVTDAWTAAVTVGAGAERGRGATAEAAVVTTEPAVLVAADLAVVAADLAVVSVGVDDAVELTAETALVAFVAVVAVELTVVTTPARSPVWLF